MFVFPHILDGVDTTDAFLEVRGKLLRRNPVVAFAPSLLSKNRAVKVGLGEKALCSAFGITLTSSTHLAINSTPRTIAADAALNSTPLVSCLWFLPFRRSDASVKQLSAPLSLSLSFSRDRSMYSKCPRRHRMHAPLKAWYMDFKQGKNILQSRLMLWFFCHVVAITL